LNSEADFIQQLTSSKHREKAFKKLLDLYQERLYWHIRKLVITHENANDVLQNTFLRVYKHLPKFQQKSTLHTWMYRIAYNESIRFLEQKNNKIYFSVDDLNKGYLNNLIEDEYFDGSEIAVKLHTILSKLPEKQRHIFQMKYYDDLKFREMSEILNIKEGTLKSSYYKTVNFIEQNITNVELLAKTEV
jgi:RNA polymerase sigma-70 factor (ECF subfamily)